MAFPFFIHARDSAPVVLEEARSWAASKVRDT
jgi:hypothetical protein